MAHGRGPRAAVRCAFRLSLIGRWASDVKREIEVPAGRAPEPQTLAEWADLPTPIASLAPRPCGRLRPVTRGTRCTARSVSVASLGGGGPADRGACGRSHRAAASLFRACPHGGRRWGCGDVPRRTDAFEPRRSTGMPHDGPVLKRTAEKSHAQAASEPLVLTGAEENAMVGASGMADVMGVGSRGSAAGSLRISPRVSGAADRGPCGGCTRTARATAGPSGTRRGNPSDPRSRTRRSHRRRPRTIPPRSGRPGDPS